MKSVIVKVNDAVQTIAEHQVITKNGQPTVIKAVNRVNYELVDQATGKAPDHIVTKRVGKDLHISMEEGNESDLIIEGYYDEVDSALIGLAEDGGYYYYIPDTGEVADFVTELAPGDIEGQALGGNAQPTPWWAGATDEGFVWLPWLIGLAGLGALAALAGNDDADDADTTAPTQTTTVTNIVDDVAPQTGDVASGGTTNDVTPTVEGTIDTVLGNDEVVAVYRDGVKVGTADVTNTAWSFEDTGLNDGESYTYTAQVEDAAGNEGSESNNYAIHLDTTAPTQAVIITTVTDDVDPVQGVVADGGITNDTDPLVAGTLSAALETGEVVVVLRNGTEVGKATVSGTTWSYDDTNLVDGQTYIYTARVEDAAGNRGAISGNYSIEIDSSAPTQTTTITNIVDDVAPQTGDVASGGTTNDSTPELQGTISTVLADGEVVAVYLDGVKIGEAAVSGTSWSYTGASLSSGSTYEYTARVEDAAGNQSTFSNDYSISINTSGPTQSTIITAINDDFAPQEGVVADGGLTNDMTPQVTGSISTALTGTETVIVLRDGIVIGEANVTGTTWTFNDSGLENSNTYEYTAYVQNASGLLGGTSNSYSITVDTVAPTQSTIITKVIDDVTPGLGEVANDGYTNDDTPELQGTISDVLASGEVVAVYRDGFKVGEATVTDTNWSYTDASLASGSTYEYTARVEDGAGNQGTLSNDYSISIDTSGSSQLVQILSVIDDFAPQEGVVADGGLTNDITPQVTGSISTALTGTETVVVLRDGIVIGEATVTGTTWTFNDSGLEDGKTYEYIARVDTAGGNQSPASQGYSIKVDTVAPTQSTIITKVIDDVTPGLGEVANDGYTNDDTPELQGTISDVLASGEVVAVYRDGFKVGEATVTDTNWSYTDASLASGSTYEYTARVEDGAGNQGTLSNDYSISIDTSGSSQSVQILSVIDDFAPQEGVVADGGLTNDITPQVTGSISTALTGTETVVVLRDGIVIGEATVTGTTWTFNDSGLEDGHTYEYIARVDTAGGNQSPASQGYSIKVDTTAPTQSTVITKVVDNVTPGIGEVANDGYTNDDTPELQGTISDVLASGEVVAVYRDGVKVGEATVTDTDWSYTDASLASGSTYEYTARVEDGAGNQGTLSNDYSISIDTSGSSQSVQILSVIDDFAPQEGVVADGGLTNDITPQVTGSISTALTGTETVVVLRDGIVIGEATVTGTTWTFNDSGLEDGHTYEYIARVDTAGGNQSPTSQGYSITIDSIPPDNTAIVTAVQILADANGVTLNEANGDGFINKSEYDNAIAVAGNKVTDVLVTLATTVAEGDVVSYSINNGTADKHIITTAEAAAHAFTISGVEIPADGDTLTVNATLTKDAAGNPVAILATATDTAKVDLTAPVSLPTIDADLTTPAFDVLYTASTSLVIKGTVSQALATGETLEVTIGGATYIVTPEADNSWSLDTSTAIPKAGSPAFVPLTSGDNSVVAKVLDEAGNANTDTTNNEVVVLAKVSNLIIEDDLTDLQNGVELTSDDDPNDPNYSVTPTVPEGNVTVIDGIESSNYGGGYLYEGIVAQNPAGTSPLAGLTNDNTPTITISLDKELADQYQSVEVVRLYQKADGEWVSEGVIASTTGAGIALTTSDSKAYTFDDLLSDDAIDKNYRYEAKVVNNDTVTDKTLANSLDAQFELDTVAQSPIIKYENGVLSGIANDTGVIYVNYAGDYKEVKVTEGDAWQLALTSGQKSAFEQINDPDNYTRNSDNQPTTSIDAITDIANNPVEDGFLPIGFVDKAGNIPSAPLEFYYFNEGDGPQGVFNPEDNPVTAINSFTDANGVTSLAGVTQVNGVNTYTTTFTDASQIIYVDGNIDAYNGNNNFVVNMAGGNDVLSLKGNITQGVIINMGEGDDTVIAKTLNGQSTTNATVIDLGSGNNTVTKSAEGNFQYIKVVAGDGDDVFNMKFTNSDLKNSSLLLGGGNNAIYSGDDFDIVKVRTGAGDDYLEVKSPINENDCDLSSMDMNLGDGNNTIIIYSGGINNYHNTAISEVIMGSGKDIVSMTKDFKDTNLSTGSEVDIVTIGGFISNDATINLGEGNDIINLGWFNDDNGSLVDGGIGQDTLRLTASSKTGGTNDMLINNIETVEMIGNNSSYNLALNDITGDNISEIYITQTSIQTDANGDLIAVVGSGNKIDLESSWNLEANTVSKDDLLNNTHVYNVYTNSGETLYIEEGISIF